MISNLKRIQVSGNPTHVLFIGGKIDNSRKVIEVCKKHSSLKCITLMKTHVDFWENEWKEVLENDTIENVFLESNVLKTEFKNKKIKKIKISANKKTKDKAKDHIVKYKKGSYPQDISYKS